MSPLTGWRLARIQHQWITMSCVQTPPLSLELHTEPDACARTAMLDVAGSGNFFSNRAIPDYAADIWNAKPDPVD